MRTSGQVMQARVRRQRKRSWRKESAAAQRQRLSSAHLIWMGKAVGAAAVVLLLATLYKPIASSSLFDLEEVVIKGNTHFPAPRAESLAREAMGSSTLAGDLSQVREVLQQQPLIKDAVVTRLLPHTLRVRLIERTPVAIVESSGHLVAVDEEGITIGTFELMGDQPALLGWADERKSELSRSTNLERLRLYLELKEVLTDPAFAYWDQLDYVDVRNPRDVVISLRHSPVTEIHLGDRDFRQRFALLLEALNAIRDRDRERLQRMHIPISDEILEGKLKITYIDVSKRPPRLWAQRRPSTRTSRKR